MKFSTSIAYQDIFNDYKEVDPKELIKDIPSVNSLQIIGHLLTQIHTVERDTKKQIALMQMWARRLPPQVIDKINQFIRRATAKNSQFNFVNNISGMLFIELLVENHNELEFVDNLTPQQELNLFKAFLYSTQEWINHQYKGFENIKIENANDYARTLIPVQLPYQEILEFKDFRTQFIKAIYFFKFCESNEVFNDYLRIFLSNYNLKSWQEYLYRLLELYTRKFEELKTPSVLSVPDEHPEVLSFLNSLSIKLEDFKRSQDFLYLRENPIYKVDKNSFLFFNLNFFIDKIYQGIQFDFAKILLQSKATYKGKELKNVVDFFGVFGTEFTETELFYKIMSHTFEKSDYVKFTGDEMKKIIENGEPDYYMRDKSKVYIFEFKNILIASGPKHSVDYESIVKELFKKLVVNEKGHPKGVTQLINTIKKIKNNDFNDFDDFQFSDAIIYPVIVYTDFSLGLPGINYILNKEFKRQLEENNLSFAKEIKDLILINIDTFIKFQDLLREKKLKLNNCFNEFIDLTKSLRNLDNNISSFDIYIHNKTVNMDYNFPKMLMNEVVIIIEDQQKHLKETKTNE
jgi:hypothetical protein